MYSMINNRVHKFNIEQSLFKNLLAGTPSTWVDDILHQLKHWPAAPLLPTVFDKLPFLPAVQSLSATQRIRTVSPLFNTNAHCA